MVGILLVSHGPMAKGVMDSYRFFNDDITQMESHCLNADDDPKSFYRKMLEACDRIDSNDGVLIITDIPGGTPANQAQIIMSQRNVEVLAGMNMLMVIEAAISRNFMDLKTLADYCEKKGSESVIRIHGLAVEKDDNEVEF